MDRSRRSAYLSVGTGLILLFALVTYRAGSIVAAAFLACGVLGYLNAFAVFRAALAVLTHRGLSKLTVALVAIAIAGSVLICYFGYWAPLAMSTGAFLVIDGLALRFKGAPAGASAGEP